MDKSVSVGVTFPFVCPTTGRRLIGFGATLDAAISDALHQWNAISLDKVRIVAIVREFAESSK